METSESKPFDEASKSEQMMSKLERVSVLRDKYGAHPMSWPYGIRCIDGVNVFWALMRKARTCRSDAKGETQAAKTARARVPMRSTGAEQPVLVLIAHESAKERRGCSIQRKPYHQPAMGGMK